MLYGVLSPGSMVSLKARPFCRPFGIPPVVKGWYGGRGVAGGVSVTAEMLLLESRRGSPLTELYGSFGIPTAVGLVCWDRYESPSCRCMIEKITDRS